MINSYDKYYQVENLFGEPYPELIEFYSNINDKGTLLDLGCGQGRDAIPLAKLGYEVTGVDNSKVGIDQLNRIAKEGNLPLKGVIEDIFSYSNFEKFDFILLDSMFHFGKAEKEKEIKFLNRLISEARLNTLITICIQKIGNKLEILHSIILDRDDTKLISQCELIYKYVDEASNHSSETKYEMVTIKKAKY